MSKAVKCLALALSELQIGNEHAASTAAMRAGTVAAKHEIVLDDLLPTLARAASAERMFLVHYLTEGYANV